MFKGGLICFSFSAIPLNVAQHLLMTPAFWAVFLGGQVAPQNMTPWVAESWDTSPPPPPPYVVTVYSVTPSVQREEVNVKIQWPACSRFSFFKQFDLVVDACSCLVSLSRLWAIRDLKGGFTQCREAVGFWTWDSAVAWKQRIAMPWDLARIEPK